MPVKKEVKKPVKRTIKKKVESKYIVEEHYHFRNCKDYQNRLNTLLKEGYKLQLIDTVNEKMIYLKE